MNKPFHIDYSSISHLYAKEQIKGTLYLAFRDVPMILLHYLPSNSHLSTIQALDFGCGTGVSTRFIQSLHSFFPQGLQVEGVDISEDMLRLARQSDPQGTYKKIVNGSIPSPDAFYDFVYSSFVLFEFASKREMKKSLEEVRRVMKPHGIFIAATGSVESYDSRYEWVSLKTNFPQNAHLKSGDLARVDFLMDEATLTFQNYYWTLQDYAEVFEQAGFHLLQTLKPQGTKQEEDHLSWSWKSEKNASPYYVFVLEPN